MNFKNTDSYYHVYFEGEQIDEVVDSTIPKLYFVNGFAHYTGNDIEQIKKEDTRIHECVCYEKYFDVE